MSFGVWGWRLALRKVTVPGAPEVTTGHRAYRLGRRRAADFAVTAVRSHSVPVSVQSDAAMRAAGNHGPSSSILVPSSCKVTATSVTAAGTYRDGFAAGVYPRYADVIDLYVFSRPMTGYPEGIQLANEPFTRHSPFIGGKGRSERAGVCAEPGSQINHTA